MLVQIDDDAFAALGHRQPLSRRYLADLARFLLASGARVVALDVLLAVPTTPEEDASLAEVARHAAGRGPSPLVFASTAARAGTDDRYRMAPPFAPTLPVLVGFPNAPLGVDGVVRRMAPVLPGAEGLLPSFALAVMAGWAGASGDALARALREDAPLRLPVRAGGGLVVEALRPSALATRDWRIDSAGPPGTVAAFPSGPLVSLARSGAVPDADNPFRGRIVVVGATFGDSRDFHPTPVGLMSGAEIQANIVHTLLGRRALLPPPWWASLGLLLAACLGVAVLSLFLRPPWLTLAALGLVARWRRRATRPTRGAATGWTWWRRWPACWPTWRAPGSWPGGACGPPSASS